MKNLLIILLFLCQNSIADLYKSIGPDGETVYTDVPSKQAKKIKKTDLPELSSYSPRKIILKTHKVKKTIDSAAKQTEYSTVQLLSPINEQTIHNGEEGNVSVSLLLFPELASSDTIVTYLDGIKSSQQKKTQFLLKNLNRGEHTLRIAVVNDKQVEKISSAMVTIYVKRTSIISRARRETRKKKIAIIRRSYEQ